METISLHNVLENENIHYSNHKLFNSSGMIAHYEDVTVIVVDEKQNNTTASMNTTLIEELGHYFSGSYYRTYSDYEVISKAEFKADKKAWEKFLPYKKVLSLMKEGYTTATQLAEYFDVEVPYMARCLNYYYNNSHGFTDDNIF